MATAVSADVANRQWFIVGRWQEFEGEGRANLLRVVALVAFYAVQLVDHHFFQERSDAESRFHLVVTLVVTGWTLMALMVHASLRRNLLPAGLKYASTACDLTFLSGLLVAGNGPASPLVVAFFPIIALSALRFSLGLVRATTLGAMAAYLALVAAFDPKWFDSQHATPVVQQLVMLLSLGLTGIIAGQVVRRVRGLAEDFARRIRAAGGSAA